MPRSSSGGGRKRRGLSAATKADRARQLLLLDCIETYLPLTRAQEARFQEKLNLKENRAVKTMRETWSERLMKKGERRGEKRGEKRAKRETLLRLLRAKFGAITEEAARRVGALDDVERLDSLLDRILTASSIEEMGL